MSTITATHARPDAKLLQITDLKTESSALGSQFDSFWRSL
jgi:hypothetical protein